MIVTFVSRTNGLNASQAMQVILYPLLLGVIIILQSTVLENVAIADGPTW